MLLLVCCCWELIADIWNLVKMNVEDPIVVGLMLLAFGHLSHYNVRTVNNEILQKIFPNISRTSAKLVVQSLSYLTVCWLLPPNEPNEWNVAGRNGELFSQGLILDLILRFFLSNSILLILLFSGITLLVTALFLSARLGIMQVRQLSFVIQPSGKESY